MNAKKPFLSLQDTENDLINSPLDVFYSGIKSKETKLSYKKTLFEFLNSVQEFSGLSEQKALQFASLSKTEPNNAKNLLKSYAIHLKKRAEKPTSDSDYLHPNTIPNKFKSIKKFLKMNEIPMEWAGIEAIYPEISNTQDRRGYTTEEIRRILEYCKDMLSELLVLVESSSGIRVGGLENLTWDCIKPIYPTDDGKYTHDKDKARGDVVCASIIIYNGTSSKYLGLISIEAWDKLQSFREQWIKRMSREPKPDDLIAINRFGKSYLTGGMRNKISKIIMDSGVQSPLLEGQRNHDVPMTHGMRYRWNKIMSEKNITNDKYGDLIRKERLFGHKMILTALDHNYFHNTIEESVPQFLEAMPELMISNEYRQLQTIQKITNENKNLQKQLDDKDTRLVWMKQMQAKIERLEKYR